MCQIIQVNESFGSQMKPVLKMELGIDDIPGEDDKKYKDGMQVGNVLIKTGLPGLLLF